MLLFKSTFRMPLNPDITFSNILTHQSILYKFDFTNKQLISKHTGNRRPRLVISIEQFQENNTHQLKIEIRLIPLLRRLLNSSIVISVLIALVSATHLTVFQIPIIANLEHEFQMMIYAYPLLVFFTMGIYYLAFIQEVEEFRRLLDLVLRSLNNPNN